MICVRTPLCSRRAISYPFYEAAVPDIHFGIYKYPVMGSICGSSHMSLADAMNGASWRVQEAEFSRIRRRASACRPEKQDNTQHFDVGLAGVFRVPACHFGSSVMRSPIQFNATSVSSRGSTEYCAPSTGSCPDAMAYSWSSLR
jgi:hypothetical protein